MIEIRDNDIKTILKNLDYIYGAVSILNDSKTHKQKKRDEIYKKVLKKTTDSIKILNKTIGVKYL